MLEVKLKWWYGIAGASLAALILKQILPRTDAVEAGLIILIFAGGLLSFFGVGCDRDPDKNDR